MGYSAAEIITRFVQYAGLPNGEEPEKKTRARRRFPDGSGSSLYYQTDSKGRVVEIDSYGGHFPLGILQLTPSGRRKRWLLNGDHWPGGGFGRTNKHNDMMREAAQKSGTPWFIVPFSAIRAAGIDPGTITPVHVEPERWTLEEHTAATLDTVPDGYRKQRVYRDADGREVTTPCTGPQHTAAYPDMNGGWYIYDRSAITGSTRVPVSGPAYDGPLSSHYEEITPGSDGLYHWAATRHWLGASLFRARYRTRETKWRNRWALFVTAFDENEPVPLWFMSELPRGTKVTTVAAALDALKPDRVREAEAAGLPVLRQGDVFAIPAAVTTRELRQAGTRIPAHYGRRYVLGTNHTATDTYLLDDSTYARGLLRHRPAERRPDHITRELGDRKQWYQLVTNTVPRSFDGRVDTSARSWSLGGRVD